MKSIEAIGRSYASLQNFTRECLLKALVARVFIPAADAAAVLQADYEEGFFLTPGLYEALAVYETSSDTLLDSLEHLLGAVDIEALLARLENERPGGR
ncbi:MAG: hypothetical protein K6U08_08885 [Firmicutes bacterium]|nr:hypothetical protein [Bacillota bacterium]